MDPRRRRLLVSLAVVPVLGGLRAAPAAEATSAPASAPTSPVLRAAAADASPDAPFRYGEGARPPVLRAARGVPFTIRLDNGLSRPTSLDLHGIRTGPALGGVGPLGGTVAAGGRADIAVSAPDAGTAWFHPWALDPGLDATARGLAGVLVVAEPVPPDVDADFVALLADRWSPPIAGRPADPDGFTIDGAALPRRETLAPGARLRLRLVNGSTRRAVTLAVAGASPVVVALDGQPSAAFRPRGDALPLGPGARCDLMLDLPRLPGAAVTVTAGTGAAAVPVLVLRTEGELRPARGPVPALAANPALPEAIALERATRATLVAAAAGGAAPGGWTVNGVAGLPLPASPAFRVKRGSPVSLAFRNAGPGLVGFRVHGFCLRLLHDRDDGWEPYWRDTLLITPGATHHAAFVADLPGRWLIESPFFDQSAGGLRTWFEVS